MSKLLQEIKKIPQTVFSFNDISKVASLNRNSLRVAVSRAVKSGELVKLSHGLFAVASNAVSLENLAVNIYCPSYISFESALNLHGILSQQAMTLTLATSKRTKTIQIGDQLVYYRHLQLNMFWGYKKEANFLLASPEKAFLDLAYLSLNGYSHFDPSEMNLDLLNYKTLKSHLKKIANRRLSNLVLGLIK